MDSRMVTLGLCTALCLTACGQSTGDAFSVNKERSHDEEESFEPRVSGPFVTCDGDLEEEAEAFTFTLFRLYQAGYVARIEKSWGGGEELDVDTVFLGRERGGRFDAFVQHGASRDDVAKGVRIEYNDFNMTGTLTMEVDPSGAESDPVYFECIDDFG